MATTDPLTTIYTGISGALGDIHKDDGAAHASVLHIWEYGPEAFKHLFYDEDYDVVITYGLPQSRSQRPIQNVPLHYMMSYPVTVTTVDKPMEGVLLCTAIRMQYKVTYALRAAAATIAQSAPAATPAYTLTIKSDASVMKRVGGIYVYETTHVLEYETDNG